MVSNTTVYPGISDPLYIVSYYVKWVTTIYYLIWFIPTPEQYIFFTYLFNIIYKIPLFILRGWGEVNPPPEGGGGGGPRVFLLILPCP